MKTPIYYFEEEFLPKRVHDNIDSIDPLEFNKILLDFMLEMEIKSSRMEDAEQLAGLIRPMIDTLDQYPTLLVEPALENLITDTKPNFTDIKLPFPSMFINKKFKFHDGYIMGIYVQDIKEFIYKTVYSDLSKEEIEEKFYKDFGTSNVSEVVDPIGFSFFYYSKGKTIAIFAKSAWVFNSEKFPKMENNPIFSNKEYKEIIRQALIYAINVANLITIHVDLKIPANPKRDVRIIPYYPDKRDRKKSNISIIRVFGPLKEYSQAYNKEKRKYNIDKQKSVVVRGHWRYLSSERFKNKRFEHIWIPPFIRGMNKELYSRVIQLKE